MLFSADAFGKFGTLDKEEPWEKEARRYYFNIVGKYGPQVQAVLKKAANLEIQQICPLHGPVLKESISRVLKLYQIWSTYEPEAEGVFIAYASLHGNTGKAAQRLAEILKEKGCQEVTVMDLARSDTSEAVECAFRYGKVVLASASYNAGVVPCMEDLLHHLKGKNYQKRKVGLMENGAWAPCAVRTMKDMLAQMKDISVAETAVTLRGVLKESDEAALEALAEEMLKL